MNNATLEATILDRNDVDAVYATSYIEVNGHISKIEVHGDIKLAEFIVSAINNYVGHKFDSTPFEVDEDGNVRE